MSQLFPLLPILLVASSSLVLVVYLFFNFLNHVKPVQVDLNFLRQKNLYLLHILEILESPDYRLLSQRNKKYRDYLFVSYAKNLKEDIQELAGLRLGTSAFLYYLSFRFFYGILILKNRIYSSAQDLRILAGIELMLVKNMSVVKISS